MYINNFIKDVLFNIKNNKSGSFITLGTITICMVILGLFLLIFVNLNSFANSIENNISVIIYLKDPVSLEAKANMEKMLKDMNEVSTVEYISKDEALNRFKEEAGEDTAIIDALDTNPLPASFKITLKASFGTQEHLQNIAASLKGYTSVESIDYGKEWIERFRTVVSAAKIILISIGVVLYIGLMLIISNTIKLSLYSNIKEIKIMKLVGATDWYIKFPFIAEGVVHGFFGANISLMILLLIYKIILFKIDGIVFNQFSNSITFIPFSLSVCIILSAMLIGCLGSLISLQKFLKKG